MGRHRLVGALRRHRPRALAAAWRSRSRVATWSGSSRPGRPRKSSSSSEPDGRAQAELLGVEEHVVEVRLGLQRLERELVDVGGATRCGWPRRAARPPRPTCESSALSDFGRSSAWSRSSSSRAACSRISGHAGQEHRRGLAAAPGPDEPADGLGEEQRRRGRRGVDPDAQPRHVDALGHHPHGDHPALVARGERLDAARAPRRRRRARRRASRRSDRLAGSWRRRAPGSGRWR